MILKKLVVTSVALLTLTACGVVPDPNPQPDHGAPKKEGRILKLEGWATQPFSVHVYVDGGKAPVQGRDRDWKDLSAGETWMFDFPAGSVPLTIQFRVTGPKGSSGYAKITDIAKPAKSGKNPVLSQFNESSNPAVAIATYAYIP